MDSSQQETESKITGGQAWADGALGILDTWSHGYAGEETGAQERRPKTGFPSLASDFNQDEQIRCLAACSLTSALCSRAVGFLSLPPDSQQQFPVIHDRAVGQALDV